MEKLVYIISGNFQYKEMFRTQGWGIADKMEEADLVLFTGGEDVTPALYGEKPHPKTFYNPVRDTNEQKLYNKALELGLPMVGICRGGQFLNVMNGGKMWQHINNHALGTTHEAHVTGLIGKINVTSTHHQMMRPNNDADHIVLMTARLCSQRERMDGEHIATRYQMEDDIESIYYPDTHVLCYQPHPEFDKGKGKCRDVFFFFINNYLLANAGMEKLTKDISDGLINQIKIEDFIPFT